MYIYSHKKKKIKRVSIIVSIVIIAILSFIKLYQIYAGIEIKDYNSVDARRLSQTVEEKKNEDLTITQMLENTTDSVVGVSKLKK